MKIKKRPGQPSAPDSGGGPPRKVLWLSGLGAGLAAGSIYLCHYTFVQELSPSSLAVLAAGLGLLGAFCVLTVAAIGGIRLLIINPGDRLPSVSALIIALASLGVLIGLVILGLQM